MFLFIKTSVQAGYETKLIFKQSLTGSNSEFSFSQAGCYTKPKEPSLPYYFTHNWRILALCEMQQIHPGF